MPPEPTPSADPSAASPAPISRQCVAGIMLLLGGLLLLISLCLPWISISPRPGTDCPACSNGPSAPPGVALVVAAWVSGIGWFLALLCLFALPLAYIFFGARLLARPAPVRGRWKVLAILGGIPLLLTILLLMLVAGLTDIDAPAVEKHAEFGRAPAWWPPIILFIASLVLPARWSARPNAQDRPTPS
ncbi:MAG TPA: hypothetical protein VFY89_07910 [Ktedonobacterales bacterium]